MTGIYCIENKINGKKYIGQAYDIKSRWRVHKCELNKGKHINRYLQSAWNKYGESNFLFYVIEITDKASLSDREMYYINKEKTFGENGYNLTAGGEGQRDRLLTDEQKKYLSEINTGAKNPNYGMKRSSETKKKISESAKLVKHKPLSEEHKSKISESLKGKAKDFNKKKVFCEDNNTTYESISEASEATGCSIYGISKCCRGVFKSTKGLHFIFS